MKKLNHRVLMGKKWRQKPVSRTHALNFYMLLFIKLDGRMDEWKYNHAYEMRGIPELFGPSHTHQLSSVSIYLLTYYVSRNVTKDNNRRIPLKATKHT